VGCGSPQMHALRPNTGVASGSTQEEVGVLAGIDTHKDTLAVAVIDGAGRPVVVTELANTEAGWSWPAPSRSWRFRRH
jgi:hypothetical protein